MAFFIAWSILITAMVFVWYKVIRNANEEAPSKIPSRFVVIHNPASGLYQAYSDTIKYKLLGYKACKMIAYHQNKERCIENASAHIAAVNGHYERYIAKPTVVGVFETATNGERREIVTTKKNKTESVL